MEVEPEFKVVNVQVVFGGGRGGIDSLAASRPELCGALWQTREGRSRVEWVEEGGEKVCMRRPACAGRSASAWAARARPD